MKFKVNNTRELYWTEDFARQNGFSFYHGYWPSVTYLNLKAHFLHWEPLINQNYPSIVNFIHESNKKEIMIYEDGILTGPFKTEIIEPCVGDKIKVVDTSFLYTSYYKWFDNFPKLAARYMYLNHGEDILDDIGTIVAMGPHENPDDGTIYAVEFDDGFNKPIFLLNREAFVVEVE